MSPHVELPSKTVPPSFSGHALQGMSFPLASTSAVALNLQEWTAGKNGPGGMEDNTEFENHCPRQKFSLIQNVSHCLFLKLSLMCRVMEHCNY